METFTFTLKDHPKNKREHWTIGKPYLALDMDRHKDRIMFANDDNEFNYVELYLCKYDCILKNTELKNLEQQNTECNCRKTEEEIAEEKKKLLTLIRSEITKNVNIALKDFETKHKLKE